MSWHLSDLNDPVSASASRAVELADAVGGLVQLGWDVLDLGWRELLVGRVPALRLLHLVGLVWVMRMLMLLLVTAVALLMRLVTMSLVGGLVLAVRSVLLMRLRIGGHLRLGGLVALLLVPVFRLVVLVQVAVAVQ